MIKIFPGNNTKPNTPPPPLPPRLPKTNQSPPPLPPKSYKNPSSSDFHLMDFSNPGDSLKGPLKTPPIPLHLPNDISNPNQDFWQRIDEVDGASASNSVTTRSRSLDSLDLALGAGHIPESNEPREEVCRNSPYKNPNDNKKKSKRGSKITVFSLLCGTKTKKQECNTIESREKKWEKIRQEIDGDGDI